MAPNLLNAANAEIGSKPVALKAFLAIGMAEIVGITLAVGLGSDR